MSFLALTYIECKVAPGHAGAAGLVEMTDGERREFFIGQDNFFAWSSDALALDCISTR
jgi:hypothetical protein